MGPETEQLFRKVFEHAPFGMCVSTLEGRFLQVNAALCRMLGYSDREMLGKHWSDLTHPEDFEACRRMNERLLIDPLGWAETEKRYLHKNGSVVWARVKISMVRGADERPFCHVVHVEDITARRRADEALREVEQRFRIMADGCPTVMWVTNAQGGVEFINRTYREFIGITFEQAEGSKWHMVLHPEDASQYIETFQRAVREHSAFKAEARIRRADGEWRWIASYAEPRLAPDGTFLGHVGLSPDITERKEMEEGLRISEAKFRQLAENIREVFWMMTASAGQMLYISPAYEAVWGRTCESVYQNPMSWVETVHPEDVERAHAAFARQLQGETIDSEYRIRTPAGQEKWIRDRAFPVRDASGEIIRIVGIAEEITQQKRYEAELILAREAAESANLAKSRFLANMSHEIRTPMNGVIGMVELLLETSLTAEQQDYATVAHSSGRTLLSLIDNILDLSKIEAGKIAMEKVNFDPRGTIGDVLRLLGASAGAKGLRVGSRVAPEIPLHVSGDPHRLRQVLTNLAANAIKFTEHGSVTLVATLEKESAENLTVRFTITDTGIGIRPEHVAALFSPFTQADASTTRNYGGTGLGLAISKQLVELMGGTIGVESDAGRGSTFWFTAVFDRAAAKSRQACEWQTGRMCARPERVLGGRAPRILIAEDNATNQLVALAQLQKLGYEATAVKNGAEAVEAVLQGGYDLVLMDCQMPVMDGFEATSRIRKSVSSAIPIIALTAGAMQEDQQRCELEMNDYLPKPVELGRLAEVLAKWLPAAQIRDEKASLEDAREMLALPK